MNHFLALACVRMRPSKTVMAATLRSLERFSAAHWEYAYDGDNLLVLVSRARSVCLTSYVLPVHGAVVGTLFSGTRQRIRTEYFATAAEQSQRVAQTAGKHLVDTFWGRYIAFISVDSHTVVVFRDPSGGLPCFLYESAGIILVFSDVGDLAALVSTPLTLNRALIGSFLKHGSRASATTGFEQITVLRPGERVLLQSKGSARKFLWNPTSIYETRCIEDVESARTVLRQTTLNAVQSWGSCFDTVVHQLSGGIDSSVVLACLTEGGGPSVVGLNYFSEIGEGDERAFARVAAAGRCELLEEVFRASDDSLHDMLRLSWSPTPAFSTWKSQLSVLLKNLLVARSAQAVFTGQGGDHLFQRRRSALIPAEFIHRHGVTVAAVRVIADTAHMMRSPLWQVLADAIWYGLFARSIAPAMTLPVPMFLSEETNAIATHDDAVHPWQLQAEGLPSAKRQQIFDLIDCQRFCLPTGDGVDVIHPLISQPIFECCLTIPTYVLTSGGRERGLLRSAFADLLPSEIVSRTSKGAATAYYYDIIADNVDFIRDYLLQGTLVELGFINKGALEHALSGEQLIFGNEIAALHNALLTEAWLRASAGLVAVRPS